MNHIKAVYCQLDPSKETSVEYESVSVENWYEM